MNAAKETSVLAVVGAGSMGGGVARNLARRGWNVRVYDPDPRTIQACTGAGVTACASLEEAVRGASHVLTSLPTPELVSTVVKQIAGSVSQGTTVIDISTIDPDTALTIEAYCHEEDLSLVVSPLGKGPAQAESGEVTLFVGGDSEVLDSLSGLFDDLGSECHRMGSVEAASVFKLVSNLVGMTNLAVLAEGLALARRVGIPDDVFDAALRQTGGTSYQQDLRLPWILAEDWTSRFGVDLALKDLRLAVNSGLRWTLALPVGSAAANQYAAASAQGYGAEDVIAVTKVVEEKR